MLSKSVHKSFFILKILLINLPMVKWRKKRIALLDGFSVVYANSKFILHLIYSPVYYKYIYKFINTRINLYTGLNYMTLI